MSKNRMMRTLFIRVSQKNIIHKDNDKLGLKAGDVYIITKQDILDTIDDWLKTTKFDYYLIEHDEDPDNIHYHLVIVFKGNSQCRFSTAKNKFPYGDIDSCRSHVHHCVRYLVHADSETKYQYDWDDIITSNPGKLEEYKQLIRCSEKQRVKNTVEDIVSGKIKKFQLTEKVDLMLCVKYKAEFDKAFKVRSQIVLKNPNRDIQTAVLQGITGAGKTTWVKAFAEKLGLSVCLSSASNDCWQDYLGQDIFCYDDTNFDEAHIEDYIKALDPFNNTSNKKRYDNCAFEGKYIFICTNTPITDIFFMSDDEHRAALFRRISYVLNFTEFDEDSFTSHYTINKIVPDRGYDSITDKNGLVTHSYKKWKLEPIDNKVHSFDLSKYIDVTHTDTKNNEFLNNITKL